MEPKACFLPAGEARDQRWKRGLVFHETGMGTERGDFYTLHFPVSSPHLYISQSQLPTAANGLPAGVSPSALHYLTGR